MSIQDRYRRFKLGIGTTIEPYQITADPVKAAAIPKSTEFVATSIMFFTSKELLEAAKRIKRLSRGDTLRDIYADVPNLSGKTIPRLVDCDRANLADAYVALLETNRLLEV